MLEQVSFGMVPYQKKKKVFLSAGFLDVTSWRQKSRGLFLQPQPPVKSLCHQCAGLVVANLQFVLVSLLLHFKRLWLKKSGVEARVCDVLSFVRQGLQAQPRLSWNSVHRWNWPWTYPGPPGLSLISTRLAGIRHHAWSNSAFLPSRNLGSGTWKKKTLHGFHYKICSFSRRGQEKLEGIKWNFCLAASVVVALSIVSPYDLDSSPKHTGGSAPWDGRVARFFCDLGEAIHSPSSSSCSVTESIYLQSTLQLAFPQFSLLLIPL